MGVEPSVGDLKDRASLERAVQGVDTVITTANSAARGGSDTVDSVEIAGNSSLIDAARDAGMSLGMPMQTAGPVTIVGEGNRRHAFVSMRDVAAFAVASVDTPAARNRQIFIGGPEPLSWNDVIARAGRLLGRELPVKRVSPGEPLSGLPDVVAGLLAGMDTYDSPVDMTDTAATFNVTLRPAEKVLPGILRVA